VLFCGKSDTRTFTCRSRASRIPAIRGFSDTLAGFLYIVPPGARFRDKPQNIFWSSVRSPHYAVEMLSASDPLLVNHELVWPTEEDLSGQVPAQLAAQAASDRDGLERELLRPGGNSPVTVFTGDDELFAFLHHEPEAYRVRSTFTYTGWWFTSSYGVISVGFGKAD